MQLDWNVAHVPQQNHHPHIEFECHTNLPCMHWRLHATHVCEHAHDHAHEHAAGNCSRWPTCRLWRCLPFLRGHLDTSCHNAPTLFHFCFEIWFGCWRQRPPSLLPYPREEGRSRPHRRRSQWASSACSSASPRLHNPYASAEYMKSTSSVLRDGRCAASDDARAVSRAASASETLWSYAMTS